jgi:hypothetical protein
MDERLARLISQYGEDKNDPYASQRIEAINQLDQLIGAGTPAPIAIELLAGRYIKDQALAFDGSISSLDQFAACAAQGIAICDAESLIIG